MIILKTFNKMSKFSLYLLFLLLLFISIPSLWSEPEQKTIAIITSQEKGPYNQAVIGFKEYLKKNKIDVQYSEYDLSQEKEPVKICEKIRNEKPTLVLAIGSNAKKLAEDNLTDIPVVYSMVLLSEPFTRVNMTGVSLHIPLDVKINALKRILPEAKKVGLVYSAKTEDEKGKITRAIEKEKLQLLAKKVDSEKDLQMAIEDIEQKIDCFWMLPDSTIYSPESVKYLLMSGLKQKFAVIGLASSYVEAGALFSLDCDYENIGQQTAELALKILNGEKAANLPAEFPHKTKLSLNLIVAEEIGLKIPEKIIKEADKVFKK